MSKELLDRLNFVKGAVGKKDLVPALTHFKIKGGMIQGYNGKVALATPIGLDIEAIPKAVPFINAIGRCTDTVQLGFTKAGKLSIKSGKFRTYIECIEDEGVHVNPEGEKFPIDGKLLIQALKILEPFISDDAARPWSNAVLFRGSSAYATNNVIVAEHWLNSAFPVEVAIRREAVKEILRVKREPNVLQVGRGSITLHYEDGSWLRAGLVEAGWPNMDQVLNAPSNQEPIPTEFYEGLNTVKPFVDKYSRVTFDSGEMRTHPKGVEEGAVFACDWLKGRATYNLEMISKLEGIAKTIDLSLYPKPALWTGDCIRGAIIGLHWIEEV